MKLISKDYAHIVGWEYYLEINMYIWKFVYLKIIKNFISVNHFLCSSFENERKWVETIAYIIWNAQNIDTMIHELNRKDSWLYEQISKVHLQNDGF